VLSALSTFCCYHTQLTRWFFKTISKIDLFCLKRLVTAVFKKQNIPILELFGASFKNPGGRCIEFLKGF
jgi:hypothetical protein